MSKIMCTMQHLLYVVTAYRNCDGCCLLPIGQSYGVGDDLKCVGIHWAYLPNS